jgi:nucleoside-diphosphate-sugar epimerase
MHQLGILGCGWLGVPLGLHLKTLGYDISGSRRSKGGVSDLNDKGINGYKVTLAENQSSGIKSFIEKLETLIISIPPGRKSNDDDYTTKIQNLLSNVDSTDIKRIIFLSSISVYGPVGGEYDELSPINPVTSASKAVYNCERLITSSTIPSIIIRLGGLIGEDRNPIFKLQNRKIRNPKGRINFIHQHDAVNGIAKLVINKQLKGVFNLVSPHHPIRKEYYINIAQRFGLPTPRFKSDPAIIRIINASKIVGLTSFRYNVDNLLI